MMQVQSHVAMMMAYTAWADDVMLSNAEQLPPGEVSAPREALFGSIAGTFDHVLVVAEIFRAHLERRAHPHTARHRTVTPEFAVIAQGIRDMNAHLRGLTTSWTAAELEEMIDFEFVSGGNGSMTRAQILLHLANHATYHRGFISVLLYPFQINTKAADLTVFLRDIWPGIASTTGSEK